MRVELTVVAPRSMRGPVDAVISAPDGTLVDDVADQLHHAAGSPGRDRTPDRREPPVDLYVDGRPVSGTPLGTPPLVDGAVLTLGPAPTPADRPLLELRTVHGPDAGRSVSLGLGDHTVGRAGGTTLRLADPTLEGVHCVVTVATGGAAVRRAAGPLTLDGHPVTTSAPLRPGQRLLAGSSTLVLTVAGEPVDDRPSHDLGDGEPPAYDDPLTLLAAVHRGQATLARPLTFSLAESQSVDLTREGAVALLGPRARTLATARWAVAQLAVGAGADRLSVVVLAAEGRGDDWSWTRWLPHLRRDLAGHAEAWVGLDPAQVTDRVTELLDVCADRGRGGASEPGYLVVVDGPQELRGAPGVERLLSQVGRHGLVGLYVDDRGGPLPPRCLPVRCAGDPPIPDGVGNAYAERLARVVAAAGTTPRRRSRHRDDHVGPPVVRPLAWAAMGAAPPPG